MRHPFLVLLTVVLAWPLLVCAWGVSTVVVPDTCLAVRRECHGRTVRDDIAIEPLTMAVTSMVVVPSAAACPVKEQGQNSNAIHGHLAPAPVAKLHRHRIGT